MSIQKSYQRKWRAAHPNYNSEWFATNPSYRAEYRQAHHDKITAVQATYRKQNPAKFSEYARTRRARKLGAFVEVVDRGSVYVRDGGICGICREAVDSMNWHLDHIQPLSKGGEHSYTNVQVTHPVCNQRKGVQ